jgi:hypothetical protein
MRPPVTLSKVFLWISISVLVSLWVTCCSVSSSSAPQPSLTTLPTLIATELPSATPTLPSLTSTSIPPTRTPSPTVSMIPTVVPSSSTHLSMLSADEAQAVVLGLLQNNGDCQLPCWWSLTPGEIDSQEAKSFLERFGSLYISSIHNEKGGYVQLHIPKNGLIVWPRLEYEINAGEHTVERFSILIEVVRKIEGGYEVVYGDPLFTQFIPLYSLPQILSTYGQPSEVLVRGVRGWWEFDLLLSYAEAGFLVNYSAPYEEEDGVYFGCPAKATIELWLWPPERNYSLSEAATMIYGERFGSAWLGSYLPLEDATLLSPETFYETYQAPQNTSCLETPKELWPEP